jgi:hypothetical protein
MDSPIRRAIISACRHFMEPVARFLMRNGIDFKEFSDVSKTAFVEVASNDYGLRGRKTNISRTAVLTGLTRKEVKRIRDELAASDTKSDPRLGRPAQLLSVWHQHDDFVDRRGAPRDLEMEGPAGFRELSRRVGGDVTPGALLTELKRSEAVDELPDGRFRVLKRHYNPSGIDVFYATRFGECLHDLAATMVYNLEHPIESERRYEYRVWNNQVLDRYASHFERIARDQGDSLLEMLDELLTTHESDGKDELGKPVRCGLGIYYFRDEQKYEPAETKKGG